jgi:hypothetical protein
MLLWLCAQEKHLPHSRFEQQGDKGSSDDTLQMVYKMQRKVAVEARVLDGLLLLLLLVALVDGLSSSHRSSAFFSRTSVVGTPPPSSSSSLLPTRTSAASAAASAATLVMRDASASYWFSVGDKVRVVEDVPKAGFNLRGRVGVVVEAWEKCDVDPTCCCAEQVERDMAVRVEFAGTEEGEEALRADGGSTSSFYHYFAEDELTKVREQEQPTEADTSGAAFDGMSCVAFKLDNLKIDEKPRRIASYEPSTTPIEKET